MNSLVENLSYVPSWFWQAIFFVYGAIIGSFLNVCIHRIPLGREIVRTPSSCPHCGSKIRWYLNVPILSWFFLLGKTECCRKPLSFRYPLVELLYALWSLLSWNASGLSFELLRDLVFGGMMLVLIFIDWEHMRLPNVLTYPGVVVGFVFVLSGIGPELLNALAASAFGAVAFLVIALGYKRLRGIEGLGMGDVKLMAMIGAFLGLPLTLFVIVLGSISALVYGIALMLITKSGLQLRIPFGSFLGGASLLLYLWGQTLAEWYIKLLV